MASDVKWIKLSVDMFDDEKIDFLSSMPDGSEMILIWVRLLTLAGKCNAGGFIMLTEDVPYTDDMLAHKFRKPITLIRFALDAFRRLKMIDVDDDGRIYLSNWGKHQAIEGMEKIREQTRNRVAEYRRKQKALPCPEKDESNNESNVTSNVTSNADVTQSSVSISISSSESNILTNEKEDKKESIRVDEKPLGKTPKNKPEKHKHGSQGNVLLTDDELSRLEAEYGKDQTAAAIEFYSKYKVEKDYRSKSDNLSMRRWVFNAINEKRGGGGRTPPPKVLSRTAMLDMEEG